MNDSSIKAGDTLVWTNSGIEVCVTELTPDTVVFEWTNGAQGQLPWSEVWTYLQPAPEPEPTPAEALAEIRANATSFWSAMTHEGFDKAIQRFLGIEAT